VIPRYQEGWTFFSFTPPPIYRKIGEELATQLAQARQVASSRSNCLLEEHPGRPKWAWLLFAPPFLLSTPLAFFGDSFSLTLWNFTNFVSFRKVTEPYGSRNYSFLGFWNVTEPHRLRNNASFWFPTMLRNLTDCVTMLPFDLRHVTELHVLCNKGCQVPRSGQTKVACHQTMVPGWS